MFNEKKFSRLNTIVGWIVFGIATFVYLSTIEASISLWDCGEFVSAAYKLEVCHPPGAPMFILIYRLFTMLASDPTQVAPLANAASALSSSFSILFLFWSITALSWKILLKGEEKNYTLGNVIAILGAGIVGGLAYTFSDTFWFSAVEGEVYASSSLFTAVVFWLALKWERKAHEKDHLRWMILIFYLIGVVIGVHLLGLLVIPVVILMYYFKMYKTVTVKGIAATAIIGLVALAVVQYGIIQYFLRYAAKFDLLFVNTFGLPYWSGVIVFFFLVMGAVIYGAWWSYQQKRTFLHASLVSVALIILGYSSYATVVIRSYANPAIDMYNNEDVYSLLGYVSREQYGDNYLVIGPYYTAFQKASIDESYLDQNPNILENPDVGFAVLDGGTKYRKGPDGTYEEDGYKQKLLFNPKYKTIFPRMFNASQENYVNGYKYWGGIKNEKNIKFSENLKFFTAYQMRYMYWRFFSWNFIGRQNDMQGFYDVFHNGNWISGISALDESIAGVGPQSELPGYLKNNAARNRYYALPFLLGILGLIFQFKKHRKDFFVVLLFFFMTGLAIALYLNMPAHQPRERDYAFVGSFYVFAIWIGMGVLFLYDILTRRNKKAATAVAVASTLICTILVPGIMGAEGWDDHDRSTRTAPRDYGFNYLQSCDSNAIFFTNGDNDTYPLWYAQEVEGFRDDVRIINLSLFSTDWYINQMRTPVNNAPALPFSFGTEETVGWDYIRYDPETVKRKFPNQNVYVNIQDVMRFIADRKNWQVRYSGVPEPLLPTKKFQLIVDKKAAISSGTVRKQDIENIVDTMLFDLNKNTVLKSEMMLLDCIAQNNWKNPIYFSMTSGYQDYPYLAPYLQLEGLTYRLVPVTKGTVAGPQGEPKVATDIMYDNMMNKFVWGKLDVNKTFVDFQLLRQAKTHRTLFARLGQAMLLEGQKDSVIKVIEKSLEVIPERNVNYDYTMMQTMGVYFEAGGKQKAADLATRLIEVFDEELNYYMKLTKDRRKLSDVRGEIDQAMYALRVIKDYTERFEYKKVSDKAKQALDKYAILAPQENQQQQQLPQ